MKKMSFLHDQYADAINAPDLHIWNNATFDNGESEEPSAAKTHLIPSRAGGMPDSCKENLKPLHPNGLTKKKTDPDPDPDPDELESQQQPARDSRDIDAEIADIESQIRQLKSRIEALSLEKKRKTATACANKAEIERRGRVVPAKFMSQPPSKRTEEEPPPIRVRSRRTMSMGPSEIQSSLSRRGFSMGPSEILAANGGGGGAIPLTPLPAPISRRKSCLLRPLQGIDEKTVSSNHRLQKQPATTGAAKRQSKKDNSFLASFRPKKLFRDDGRSVPSVSKKQGRVVASRYSQVQAPAAAVQLGSKSSEVRKRADSESVGRVKKRWEIPNCVVIHKSGSGDCEEEESPSPIPALPDLLPRIRIGRCDFESPRDSGAAKRVAVLVGKRSFFCPENDEGASAPTEEVVLVCKALKFEE